MPFAEDLRRFSFPTLTLLRNRKGKEITEHSMLPTDKQKEAMSSFVEAMDLDSAAVDDDGCVVSLLGV
jgi:ATP-dependent DNA helicase 2 subunit 2